jgi:response regulator RpfG family c-di-GMP phosphodiesterase
MMEKMVSMQEATEKSLKELHHQVSELKKQTPQSNQNSRPGRICRALAGTVELDLQCFSLISMAKPLLHFAIN